MGFLSDLLEKTKPAQTPLSIDEGDHERFSHFVLIDIMRKSLVIALINT